MLSPEIHVMLAPARAYAQYAPAHTRDGLWVAFRRPLFLALVQGVAIAMVATRTVAAPVLASVTLCWTAAILVQLMAAAVVITRARARTVSFGRALDLLFLGHAPWSLWLLAVAATVAWPLTHFTWWFVVTMAVPAVLTSRILFAFAVAVLRMQRREALAATVLHQTIVWTTFLMFFANAVALWPRVVGTFGR